MAAIAAARQPQMVQIDKERHASAVLLSGVHAELLPRAAEVLLRAADTITPEDES
jgi:hypothetical protein